MNLDIFFAARHVGVRVEAFSVGFPPTLWGKKIGDTEYRISWIPVGGYVKLFGQNVDDEDPDDPTNYASKTFFNASIYSCRRSSNEPVVCSDLHAVSILDWHGYSSIS